MLVVGIYRNAQTGPLVVDSDCLNCLTFQLVLRLLRRETVVANRGNAFAQ